MTANKKRYIIVMILGVLLNEVLYRTASAMGWPVWMDMTGTMLAALVLEPAAGLLVGLVNNFILAAFVYQASSLVYYSISAVTALIIGLGMKKNGKLCLSRLPLILVMTIAASGLLSGLITIWHNWPECVPDALSEQHFYAMYLQMGILKPGACVLAIVTVKVFDILISAALVGIIYVLLPAWLKEAPKHASESGKSQILE